MGGVDLLLRGIKGLSRVFYAAVERLLHHVVEMAKRLVLGIWRNSVLSFTASCGCLFLLYIINNVGVFGAGTEG